MTREQFEEEIKEIEALTWYKFTPVRKEMLYKICQQFSNTYFREKALECFTKERPKPSLKQIINKIQNRES